MGLIVSITLVLGLIFYWEGRRLYKETEEHSKLQRIAITIKLGGISYLKSLWERKTNCVSRFLGSDFGITKNPEIVP